MVITPIIQAISPASANPHDSVRTGGHARRVGNPSVARTESSPFAGGPSSESTILSYGPDIAGGILANGLDGSKRQALLNALQCHCPAPDAIETATESAGPDVTLAVLGEAQNLLVRSLNGFES